MSWKIEKDSYYYPIYKEFGQEMVEKAGFIYDSYEKPENFENSNNIICTHLPKIDKDNSVVLLTSGAFCPFHNGHLDMMIRAKNALEKIGKNVVAGYISPSHDEYVFNKVASGYHINKRIKIIENKIKNYDWLFVDPWEGVFTKYALNFTDVIERLKKYILFYTGKDIPIYFVCGSDNARFALTFINKGHCVVVNRPGYEDDVEIKNMVKTDRVLWTHGNSDESSTDIRKKESIENEISKAYIRRENYHPFELDLLKLFKSNFDYTEIADVDEQRDRYEEIKPKSIHGKKINTISLDKLIDGDANLNVSRLYGAFGIRKLGYFSKGLNHDIDFNECYLFDDDICTGGTIEYASNVLEKYKVKVNGIFTFKVSKQTEIIDCRDFLILHPEGGLVVKLPNGKNSRVPYIYPFVCPYLRASVKNPLDFSIKVWELNYKFFLLNKDISVSEVLSIEEALICSGFDENEKMYNVCKYYIDFLKGLK